MLSPTIKSESGGNLFEYYDMAIEMLPRWLIVVPQDCHPMNVMPSLACSPIEPLF